MQSPPDGARPGASDPPDLDPDDVLERDAHVLLDPRFLGGLHTETARSLPPEQTARALERMGFLHGLQDAHRARALASARGETGCFPPLAMRYRIAPGGGGLEVRGLWPDGVEAAARLAASAVDAAGSCALSAGYTSGWLSGMLDADLFAVEETCGVEGHDACRFVAREASAWQRQDPQRAARAAGVPYDAYRALVRAREARRAIEKNDAKGDGPVAGIDRSSACVHIWGPVMVLPFAGADEGLRTLDLLGRDPEAREVSVVVIDLAEAIIDPAFGALALELIVRSADAWGAETIFAGPSPLAEPVLAELEHPPLLVFKELERAIAAAFQIAAVQKRVV